MYAYRMQPDGRASDLRFVRADYQPQPDEHTGEGDVLPDIETLHSPEYKAARDAAKDLQDRIRAVESQITARRLREAILTQEGRDWLAAKEAEIAAERVKR